MNTGIFVRGVAVVLAWAGMCGLASAQALGSTAEDETTVVPYKRLVSENAVVDQAAADAVERMGDWLGTFDRVRAGLAANDGFIRSDDELVLAFLFEPMEGESKLLRQYLKNVSRAMGTVPDAFYDDLDTKVAALWSEIERLAPRVAPITGPEADGTLRTAIERRVTQGAPEARIVRTVLTGDDWTVRVSDVGLPRSEYRRGYVMYRLPDQELVVCQQLVIERPYFGASERPADYTVRLGYLRLQERP